MQERVIPIASGAGDGPGDEGCADLLVTTLTGHKGIDAVAFDPKQHAFRIRYDPDLVSLATVERLADQVGVQLGERYQRCVYHMDGVTCRNCGRAIERQLKRDPRIIWASANPPSDIMFELTWKKYIGTNAAITAIGNVRIGISAERK